MTALAKIPKSLLSQARSLEHLGLKEVAWPRHVVLDVLQAVQTAGAAILGGDVYAEESGVLRSTFEGWHSDRSRGEPLPRFAQRSWKDAREYISRYPTAPHRDLYFVLVLDDQSPSKGK